MGGLHGKSEKESMLDGVMVPGILLKASAVRLTD